MSFDSGRVGIVPAAAREYLLHSNRIVAECGGPIRSPLLTVDPVVRHQYEHLEYKPLVNARAHSLGQRRQIVNNRLHEQYHRFLNSLSYHSQLQDEDKLAVTYYLLLQDRIEDALAAFGEVHPEQLATRLQYDYCAAHAFDVLVHQLGEGEGKGANVVDIEDRGQRQGQARRHRLTLGSRQRTNDYWSLHIS
jgi:hypothetical protein